LRNGIVRVLHNLSFVEDPTRVLRAVRFEQRFGFKMDARTAELLTDALDMLNRVSGDRIRHELRLIYRESEPEKALTRLNALGVLKAIYPKLA
jgi:tRNA nucleotidyltransferase (CCA-adding enzyme)